MTLVVFIHIIIINFRDGINIGNTSMREPDTDKYVKVCNALVER
jgi:hypothetical protein